MRGQILSATTGRSGIVLDDNGSRYTFVSDEWRNVSVRAEPGMTVEFIPQGSMATDVRSTAVPTNYAPPAPAATNYQPAPPAPAATNYQAAPPPAPAAANYQAAPPPPPPPPAPGQAWSGGSNPYPPPGQTGWTPPNQQAYAQPAPQAHYWHEITTIPENLKTKKNLHGFMLILLGPFWGLIAPWFFGYRHAWAFFLFTLIAIPILAAPAAIPLILAWMISVVIGVVYLAGSDEKFIKWLHYRRAHSVCVFNNKNEKHCITRDCLRLHSENPAKCTTGGCGRM